MKTTHYSDHVNWSQAVSYYIGRAIYYFTLYAMAALITYVAWLVFRGSFPKEATETTNILIFVGASLYPSYLIARKIVGEKRPGKI